MKPNDKVTVTSGAGRETGTLIRTRYGSRYPQGHGKTKDVIDYSVRVTGDTHARRFNPSCVTAL